MSRSKVASYIRAELCDEECGRLHVRLYDRAFNLMADAALDHEVAADFIRELGEAALALSERPDPKHNNKSILQ